MSALPQVFIKLLFFSPLYDNSFSIKRNFYLELEVANLLKTAIWQ